MSDFDDSDIVVAPEALEFTENDCSEQLVSIENWSEEHGVFRVKASIANLFVLGEANGIVESSTAVEFPISLKSSIPAELQHLQEIEASVTVEFVPWTDDYEDEGVRAFWASRGKHALKKSIPSVVRRAASGDNPPPAQLSRAMTLGESESFTAFSDAEEEPLATIPEEASTADGAPAAQTPPPAAVATPPARPAMNFMDEMKSRQGAENSGLKAAPPLPSPAEKSRRRSMYDNPMGGGLFDELRQKQEKLAEGEAVLKHVHVKTAAEKEQERIAALATVPVGGFTNIMDELKHFSYMLNQSTIEATSDPIIDDERERVDSEYYASQHAEELVEKDNRISELNAEIQRIMEQHDAELEAVNEQKNIRISALEKQNETKIASVIAQYEAQIKNGNDEHASRVASLTEHYESRIQAMAKQQEEMGGQEELLEQQRVMMEAFTKAKENEIKDTIMHQELKFGALMQNQEERIAELTQELEDLRHEKDDEITRLTDQHSHKVKGLMNQQAVAISTLSTQLESTMKVQRERVEALTKQLGDLHQRKLAEAAGLRQQYDAKLKAYSERCEQITAALQQQVDDLTVRLQRAELQNKVNQESSPSLQTTSTFVDPPQHLYSPALPRPVSNSHYTQQLPIQMESPQSPPIAAAAPVQPRVQEFAPQTANPFLKNPSAGGHAGPSKPHYTTSVRQLQGRRPQRSGSTKDILGDRPISTGAPIQGSVPMQPVAAQPVASMQQQAMAVSAADSVSVAPGALRFIAGLAACEDAIYLHNRGMHPIAFKIRVSVKNVFTLPDAGGVLMGGEQKALPVIMKDSHQYRTIESIPKAKFLVELVPADDGYNILGAKGFWEAKSAKDIVKKQILSEYQIMN